MTGNKNMWRAPLAGLASLAMVATMGVAASTANAADLGDDLKVTAATASATAKYGQTLSEVDGTGFVAGTPVTDKFVGWYSKTDGNEPADFTASLHGDLDLVAKTLPAADTITVNFTDATPHFPDSSTSGTSISVAKSEGVIPSTRLPFYYQKAVLSWDVTNNDTADTYHVTAADAAANGLELKGDASSYTVKPNFANSANLVKFIPQTLTNVSGVADWDTSATGAELQVPVAKGYAPVAAPEVVYSANPAGVPNAKVYTQWINDKGDIIKIGDPIPETATGNFKLDESSVSTSVRVKVTFDLNGGKSDITNPQYVNKGTAVAKPADPTRDGYVFQGWKAVSGASNNEEGFYDFDSKLAGDVTLQAQWAKVADIKVTFSAGDYAGAGDDATITVAGDAFVDESKAPKFTREGYTYDSWFLDKNGNGQKDASEVAFDFDTTLAGEANGGRNFTLIPVWTLVDENMAKQALKYVATGIKGSAAKLDDPSAQVEVSDKDYFTDASWTEFEKVYKAQYQKYLSAAYKDGSTVKNEVPASTSAEIVNALKDAWKGLRFSAKTADTVLDGKHADNATAQVIYRLNRLGGLHHLLSGDENEVKNLTNKYIGQGGWTKDETTFRTVNNIDYNADGSIKGLLKSKWVDGIDNVAPALLKQVTRLYNSQLQEHMYTSDQNEIDTLTAGDWTEDSNLASFYVPALYNGSTKVTRLYNPSTHLHLYTADSHEVSVLTGQGGWTKDSDNASFYAL